MSASHIQALLLEGQALGLFANAQLVVQNLEDQQFATGVGQATWFDYASLTKPLATGLLTAQAFARQQLHPEELISSWFEGFRHKNKASIRVVDLLSHRAGLVAYKDWYRQVKTAQGLLTLVIDEELAYAPQSQTRYSDAGFILLAAILEQLAGRPLAQQVTQHILNPLDEQEACWTPLAPHLQQHCASSGFSHERNRVLQGEVYDENAFILGEHAGHAGLFGTAAACCRLGLAWLKPITLSKLGLSKRSVTPFLTLPTQGRPWAWDRMGPGPSQAGTLAPNDTIGHLGFTGTSLWMSPKLGVAVALLTDRIAHDTNGDRFRAWRPKLHDAIWPNLPKLLSV